MSVNKQEEARRKDLTDDNKTLTLTMRELRSQKA